MELTEEEQAFALQLRVGHASSWHCALITNRRKGACSTTRCEWDQPLREVLKLCLL